MLFDERTEAASECTACECAEKPLTLELREG